MQCCGSGCLSRILIFTHPGSRIPDLGSGIPDLGSRISDLGSRISDPGSRIKKQQQKRKLKKKFLTDFFCSHKLLKMEYYFIFEMPKKKFRAHFLRIIEVFTQKNFIMIWLDMGLGSGIREKPIPDPRSRGQKGTGSRIRIRNTGTMSVRIKYFRFSLNLSRY